MRRRLDEEERRALWGEDAEEYYARMRAAVAATGDAQSVPLGVEPILFGLFTMGWDFLFLGLRQLGKKILSDARHGNETTMR